MAIVSYIIKHLTPDHQFIHANLDARHDPDLIKEDCGIWKSPYQTMETLETAKALVLDGVKRNN